MHRSISWFPLYFYVSACIVGDWESVFYVFPFLEFGMASSP
uniref:Uncharacterized protein n=1 Tax=Arundo donax TaxID=35708 RepID=A0A0A9GRP9_ARUDO